MTCDGCEPVEQIRGEMGPGDYYDVIANNKGATGSVPEPEKYGYPIYDNEIPDGINPAHCVEMHDGIKDSFRICCKKCGRASPWGAKDFPGMPGAGADWTRKKWNEAA